MSVLRAREAFACSDAQGTPRVIRPGDLFDSSDPMVIGRESLFDSVEVATQRAEAVVAGGGVESATAAPGEKRSVSAGRGKRTKTTEKPVTGGPTTEAPTTGGDAPTGAQSGDGSA